MDISLYPTRKWIKINEEQYSALAGQFQMWGDFLHCNLNSSMGEHIEQYGNHNPESILFWDLELDGLGLDTLRGGVVQ